MINPNKDVLRLLPQTVQQSYVLQKLIENVYKKSMGQAHTFFNLLMLQQLLLLLLRNPMANLLQLRRSEQVC